MVFSRARQYLYQNQHFGDYREIHCLLFHEREVHLPRIIITGTTSINAAPTSNTTDTLSSIAGISVRYLQFRTPELSKHGKYSTSSFRERGSPPKSQHEPCTHNFWDDTTHRKLQVYYITIKRLKNKLQQPLPSNMHPKPNKTFRPSPLPPRKHHRRQPEQKPAPQQPLASIQMSNCRSESDQQHAPGPPASWL